MTEYLVIKAEHPSNSAGIRENAEAELHNFLVNKDIPAVAVKEHYKGPYVIAVFKEDYEDLVENALHFLGFRTVHRTRGIPYTEVIGKNVD